jgi:NitT/TauT family transport system substrate-binding protein
MRVRSFVCSMALALLATTAASAEEPINFLLSWRAQAENGGYYTALLKGHYAACGLNVTIRQGGAGIDPMQLLTGGAVDVALVSQNDGAMRMNEAGFPARVVFAAFQKSPQSFDVHPDSGINSFEDMRGHPIMVAAGGKSTYWPYFKQKYGFSDDQLRTFTGQFAPFLADKRAVTQDLITNGPYVIEQAGGPKVKPFLFADYGYNPYSSTMAVPQKLIDQKPAAVQCLVDASRKGWADYLEDPKLAFAEIARIAPENSPGLLDYSFETMRAYDLVGAGKGGRAAIGAMTDERWAAHADMLVKNNLFKPDVDYKRAYTLQFLKNAPQ